MPPNRTTLGSDCNLTGDLVLDGDAVFLGRLEGTLRADGPVEIGGGAMVRGIVDADTVRLAGRVEGQLIGRDRVTLLGGSRFIGEVSTARLEVAAGATFEGVVIFDSRRAPTRVADSIQAQAYLNEENDKGFERDDEDADAPDAINVILQRRRIKPRRVRPGAIV